MYETPLSDDVYLTPLPPHTQQILAGILQYRMMSYIHPYIHTQVDIIPSLPPSLAYLSPIIQEQLVGHRSKVRFNGGGLDDESWPLPLGPCMPQGLIVEVGHPTQRCEQIRVVVQVAVTPEGFGGNFFGG